MPSRNVVMYSLAASAGVLAGVAAAALDGSVATATVATLVGIALVLVTMPARLRARGRAGPEGRDDA